MCECGEVKEIISHILRRCKLFEELIVHMREDLMRCKIFPPYFIEAILHCMIPEAVIPVAQCISRLKIRI
jgi:hypothetical protein